MAKWASALRRGAAIAALQLTEEIITRAIGQIDITSIAIILPATIVAIAPMVRATARRTTIIPAAATTPIIKPAALAIVIILHLHNKNLRLPPANIKANLIKTAVVIAKLIHEMAVNLIQNLTAVIAIHALVRRSDDARAQF